MLRFFLFFALFILLARALWRLLSGIVDGITGEHRMRRPAGSSVHMVRDPICGTFVVPDRALTVYEGGRAVHFCSVACRDKYRARTA